MPDPQSGNEPEAAMHQVATSELLGLAPGLDSLRLDPEPGVWRDELARVEAGLGGKGVAELVRDFGGGNGLRAALDQNQVSRGPNSEADPARGEQIPTGRAGRRGRYQQRHAVPQE